MSARSAVISSRSKSKYPQTLEEAWKQHLAPKPKNAPTVISTFAGCGGSTLGYSMAGFRELLAVEWDDNAVETFKLNYPKVPVYHGDIAKLDVSEVLKLANIKKGQLDVFDGSPPCQGFSTIGRRQIDDPRNSLFKEYVRLLKGIMPRAFVMENVSGLVKGKMKLIFCEILQELKKVGYDVSARLLDSRYFGVPQMRQRMIFIGMRKDLKIVPSHPLAETFPINAGEAIQDIVNDKNELKMLFEAGEHYKSYSRWHIMAPGKKHTDYGGTAGFSGFKIDPMRPMRTISKMEGNIGIHQSMHWAEKRRFTLAEYKRFSSYPEPFQFTGWSEGVQRIGNSVPPLMMRAIARHLRKLLGK
jgi:DNA (cytosine-5)-methyltransferase 1